MKKFVPFVICWVVNSAILYLAARYFPMYFVLGTFRMGVILSAAAAGFFWTLLTWLAKPLANRVGLKPNGRVIMFGFYFLADFVALWITSRLAPYFGFGVTSFVWLVGLAIAADVIQYAAWKLTKFLV